MDKKASRQVCQLYEGRPVSRLFWIEIKKVEVVVQKK